LILFCVDDFIAHNFYVVISEKMTGWAIQQFLQG